MSIKWIRKEIPAKYQVGYDYIEKVTGVRKDYISIYILKFEIPAPLKVGMRLAGHYAVFDKREIDVWIKKVGDFKKAFRAARMRAEYEIYEKKHKKASGINRDLMLFNKIMPVARLSKQEVMA